MAEIAGTDMEKKEGSEKEEKGGDWSARSKGRKNCGRHLHAAISHRLSSPVYLTFNSQKGRNAKSDLR